MNKKKDYVHEFRACLEKMFRLVGADDLRLNSGIYRVIRLREKRIREGLLDKLPEMVAGILGDFAKQDAANIDKKLQEAEQAVRKHIDENAFDERGEFTDKSYATMSAGKHYLEVKEEIRIAKQSSKTHDNIFNHLLQFFERYYEGGDFMPRRRITNRGAYSLPYNGQDVMLHWANRGQYYVKSSNRFLSYSFQLKGGVTVKFVVGNTDSLPENNNKDSKKFFFPQLAELSFVDNILEIPFVYRAPIDSDGLDKANKAQERINAACIEAASDIFSAKIPKAIRDELLGGEKSILLRHIERYYRTNDSDFFIHKNLAGFLCRELDAYIKNAILDLHTIATGDRLAIWAQTVTARAVYTLGSEIITRLSELEEFQKKLWEKKKFIIGTHYIVRLGAVDTTALKNLLLRIVNCNAQWQEWEKLGIDVGDKSEQFLRAHPSLPLDTKNFDAAFCDELIASFDNLDDVIDGVCFHGDNWQVLNLMTGKYAGQVNCVYIDPPYNTDSSAIIYKNNYKDSSWLSLMHDRVNLTQELLSDSGVFCCAIDDEEHWRLRGILDNDYFAGSSITAHAVMTLNRHDNGRRKFILAEMGEYFDTVLLPRIKKVIYSPYWKNGMPSDNGNGNNNELSPDEAAARAPRIVKYHQLESYEDSMENIEFAGDNTLAMEGDGRYMWAWESKESMTFASLESLSTPFDFKIKRAGKDKVSADLPETFNLMIGMHLQARRVLQYNNRRYQFDIGTIEGKETICVWRNIDPKWQEKDYEQERDFIRNECAKIGEEFTEFFAARIMTNGTSAVSCASTDPRFIKLMLA